MEQKEQEAIGLVLELEAEGTKDGLRQRRFRVNVDEGHVVFESAVVIGKQLLGHVGKNPCRYALVQVIPHGDDQFIDPDEQVDLSQPGVEKFITVLKDIVTMTVDDKLVEARRGPLAIAEIKRLAGVSDAYRLAQDVDGVLKDLAEGSTFEVEGCEVFESRPSAGGAS